jgi:hypothetical protein
MIDWPGTLCQSFTSTLLLGRAVARCQSFIVSLVSLACQSFYREMFRLQLSFQKVLLVGSVGISVFTLVLTLVILLSLAYRSAHSYLPSLPTPCIVGSNAARCAFCSLLQYPPMCFAPTLSSFTFRTAVRVHRADYTFGR